MGRPKKIPYKRRSRVLFARVREEEEAAFKQFAASLGETPSRVMRRLMREAINGGPDYFQDGRYEIRQMRIHLTAIGRNLNQLTRAVNRGELVSDPDLIRVINAGRVQVAAAEEVYHQAIRAAAWRTWRPLYREAGLPSPFDGELIDTAGRVRNTAAWRDPSRAAAWTNFMKEKQ